MKDRYLFLKIAKLNYYVNIFKINYCFILQFGSFIIKHLSDYIPQMFESHITTFATYFIQTLNSAEDCTSLVVYNTISSMNNILELSVQVPQVLVLIEKLVTIS